MRRTHKYIVVLMILLGVCIHKVEVSAEVTEIYAPNSFVAIQKGDAIKIKWNRPNNAKGFIIYKNGKKLKKLNKTTIVDKKVKKNKIYKYQIRAFTRSKGKRRYSKLGNAISSMVSKKDSKKTNAGRIVYLKKNYNIHLKGKIKLRGVVKPIKKAGKKKVFDKKIRWSSSDNSIATVDSKGVVKANKDMKEGIATVYARTHNGITKKITINIYNYAYPKKIKNEWVLSKDIKPLLAEHMSEMSKIATYFEFRNKNNEIKFDIDDKGVLTKSSDTIIDQDIEQTLYSLISSMPITVSVHEKYITFDRLDYTTYGTGIMNSIMYIFNDVEESEIDTGYERAELAPAWYYQYAERNKTYFKNQS